MFASQVQSVSGAPSFDNPDLAIGAPNDDGATWEGLSEPIPDRMDVVGATVYCDSAGFGPDDGALRRVRACVLPPAVGAAIARGELCTLEFSGGGKLAFSMPQSNQPYSELHLHGSVSSYMPDEGALTYVTTIAAVEAV